MMKIKTFIAPSKIPGAGLGIFTVEKLKKDTILWAYDSTIDREISQATLDAISDPLIKNFLITYSFKFRDNYYLCVDNARFFNHSSSPNCYSTDYSETCMGFTRALIDIEAGEELTDDYSTMGYNDADNEHNKL